MEALACGQIVKSARMKKDDAGYNKPNVPKEAASLLFCYIGSSLSEEIKNRVSNQGGVSGDPGGAPAVYPRIDDAPECVDDQWHLGKVDRPSLQIIPTCR